MTEPVRESSTKPVVPSASKSKLWPVVQLGLSLLIVTAFLLRLIFAPHGDEPTAPQGAASRPAPAVKVEEGNKISVAIDSPLGERLPLQSVATIKVTDPLLRVTGRVIASRRPGGSGKDDYWQFHASELLDTYAAWDKASADIQFTELQLKQTQELVDTKELALRRATERLERLVKSGTEAERDLATQKADLLQTQIQDRKDVYQAEVAVKSARREATTLTLQLLQSGIDPDMLKTATSDMDIITAEVPEAMLGKVVVGQSCTARFFGVGDQVFEGKVTSLSPVLSTEQRTLRVLFVIRDPVDRLRPGMFATIGLGTDPRDVIRIPAASVIHVGRRDYVLVADNAATQSDPSTVQAVDSSSPKNFASHEGRRLFRIVEVEVSEFMDGKVELSKGLTAGDQIVADNAILLQPFVVSTLQKASAKHDSASPSPVVGGNP